MYTCFHWMYVYAPHCASCFQRPERPERPSDALEVELQMFVGHHMCAELSSYERIESVFNFCYISLTHHFSLDVYILNIFKCLN